MRGRPECDRKSTREEKFRLQLVTNALGWAGAALGMPGGITVMVLDMQ